VVDQLLASFFGITLEDYTALFDYITAAFVAFLAYPLCILKEFHRIKVDITVFL
jgi:hypothetical protein